ncbi:MAG: cytochrome P450 [Actinocrinis sp.]
MIPGGLPLLGHAGTLLRDPLGFLERVYPFGEVATVRLGVKPACLVNGSEPLRRILVADAASYDKGFQFDQLRTLIGDGVGTSGGAKHRRQRRLMRPAFDHRHVEGYVASMVRCATQTTDRWRRLPDPARIDAGQEMRRLAMTAISRAMFGTGAVGIGAADLGAEGSPDAAAEREVLGSLPILLGGVGRRALLPLGVINKAPTPGNLRFNRAQRALHAMADRMVADHRARLSGQGADPGGAAGLGPDPDAAPTLLDTLLAAVDEDGAGMTDAQAHDEIMTVLLAGTETSAGTLAWTLHVLAADRELQFAVQQEADTLLGGRAPAAADLGSLPLTRRVVSEVLRCYPPSYLLGRRPIVDVEIAGVPVPAGTQVLLNFYGLHHDPQAYPDPSRFDPDRWLNPDPEVLRTHYLPFGLGLHGCVGDGFAWSLILSTVAVIASRYTVRPVPGSVVRPVARTTLHPGVVPLLLEPR